MYNLSPCSTVHLSRAPKSTSSALVLDWSRRFWKVEFRSLSSDIYSAPPPWLLMLVLSTTLLGFDIRSFAALWYLGWDWMGIIHPPAKGPETFMWQHSGFIFDRNRLMVNIPADMNALTFSHLWRLSLCSLFFGFLPS